MAFNTIKGRGIVILCRPDPSNIDIFTMGLNHEDKILNLVLNLLNPKY